MAITKEQKVAILAKLGDILKSASSIAFVRFTKLRVGQANEMRRALKERGVGYFVAKKTLIARALEGKKPMGDAPALEGEIAVAFTEGADTLAPHREVSIFTKKFEKAVELVGGIFEGAFVGREGALSLAAIPPRETLFAQFVNLVNSPLQRLAVALNEVSKIKS